jgi:hypothetical protein
MNEWMNEWMNESVSLAVIYMKDACLEECFEIILYFINIGCYNWTVSILSEAPSN